MAEMEWVGRAVASVTANPVGTWTPTAFDYYHWADLKRMVIDFGVGDVNFHLSEFSIGYEYGSVEMVGQSGSGSFQTFYLSNPKPMLNLSVVKDSDFHTMLSNNASGTAIDINIG